MRKPVVLSGREATILAYVAALMRYRPHQQLDMKILDGFSTSAMRVAKRLLKRKA
jgi:hypothetical protein